jgi:hypothetical protein
MGALLPNLKLPLLVKNWGMLDNEVKSNISDSKTYLCELPDTMFVWYRKNSNLQSTLIEDWYWLTCWRFNGEKKLRKLLSLSSSTNNLLQLKQQDYY